MGGLSFAIKPSGWRLVVASFLAGLATVLIVAASAHGKLCGSCAHNDGLAQFYTRSPTTPCQGSIKDPINVVWYDNNFKSKFADTVRKDLQLYSVPPPPPPSGPTWFQVPATDPQTIRDVLGTCPGEAEDAGTDGPLSSDRDHVRLFNVDTSNHWFVVGDAHHDHDPGGLGVHCHGSTSFDGPNRLSQNSVGVSCLA